MGLGCWQATTSWIAVHAEVLHCRVNLLAAMVHMGNSGEENGNYYIINGHILG